MSRSAVAIGAACGFLAGVLLVIALGSGGGNDTTVTREHTVTVVSNTLTNGGTVITQTAVPALVGERLDVAKDRIRRAGFDADVQGGGLFGIIEDSNWQVVTQSPDPGTELEQGSTVHIRVEKR